MAFLISGSGRLVPTALLDWIKPQRTFLDMDASERGQYIRPSDRPSDRRYTTDWKAMVVARPSTAAPRIELLSSAGYSESSKLSVCVLSQAREPTPPGSARRRRH